VIIILAGANGLKIGLIIFIFTLGLGYRSIYITSRLTLHPSELLIWGLFVILLLQHRYLPPGAQPFRLPLWVKLLIPFWILAWITGSATNRSWMPMLQEMKNFLVLLPLFFVSQAVLAERKNWRPVIQAFFLVGVWIAGMGVLEYFYPGLISSIPGFSTNPYAKATVEGFRRATFSFYGSAVASFFLMVSMPMAHVLWDWHSTNRAHFLILLGVFLQIGGVYISGFRSLWLLLILEIALWILLRFGFFVGLFSLTLLVPLSLWLAPIIAEERFSTLFKALEGGPTDSSALDRLVRAEVAWSRTLKRPWGSGWSSSGWVHNDFLQISMAQGIIPALIIVFAWFGTLFRLGQKIFNRRRLGGHHYLAESLFLALFAGGGVMVSQGTTWLVHLILPIWFIWVLADIWLGQSKAEPTLEESEEKTSIPQQSWQTPHL
jgi:hypothetical protein